MTVGHETSDASRDVFLSYASADSGIAEAVCRGLERAGTACWIAPRDVAPGAQYADAIVRAINGARVLVLVLSENAVASARVGKEIERASSKRRPIIALRVDAAPLTPAFEYFLSESQWIDAPGGVVDGALPRLSAAVRRLLDSSAVPSVVPSVVPGAVPGGGRRNVYAWAGALAGAALVIAAGWYWLGRRGGEPPPPPVPSDTAVFAPPAHSVAVLPFENLSGDREQDYFSDGLSNLKVDPLLDPARGEARFQGVLAKLKFPD